MHVKCLEYIVYGPTGWGWKSHKVSKPNWNDVERAIRRLDCFENPSVLLWGTEEESKQRTFIATNSASIDTLHTDQMRRIWTLATWAWNAMG